MLVIWEGSEDSMRCGRWWTRGVNSNALSRRVSLGSSNFRLGYVTAGESCSSCEISPVGRCCIGASVRGAAPRARPWTVATRGRGAAARPSRCYPRDVLDTAGPTIFRRESGSRRAYIKNICFVSVARGPVPNGYHSRNKLIRPPTTAHFIIFDSVRTRCLFKTADHRLFPILSAARPHFRHMSLRRANASWIIHPSNLIIPPVAYINSTLSPFIYLS